MLLLVRVAGVVVVMVMIVDMLLMGRVTGVVVMVMVMVTGIVPVARPGLAVQETADSFLIA